MKVNINVPTSLSDIKLSQYQKFVRTTKDSEDENFITRQMVGIFCNVPDKVVDNIKASDYDSIVEDISKVLSEKPIFKPIITYNGKEYGFIPKLDDITVGEKADIDSNFNNIDKMDIAMGVLYRPITYRKKDTYLIEDYNGDAVSLDLSLDIVFGANVFFSNLTKDLLNYIQNCIEAEAVHNHRVSQILEKNGDGTTVFMNSLEETFLGLKRLVS